MTGGPCTMPAPGIELPMIDYYPADCLKGDDADIRTLNTSFYRAIMRCYALELFPLEVFSVTKWRRLMVETFDSAAVNHRVTVGARFKLDDRPLQFDPHVGLRVSAKRAKRAIWDGIIQAPQFEINDGLWEGHFYYENVPEYPYTTNELRFYQNKCIRVLIRLASLGLRVQTNRLFKTRFKVWLGLPDFTKIFYKPFAGAVVRTDEGQVGWVVRELGDLVVVEHEADDECTERTYPYDTLEVLG